MTVLFGVMCAVFFVSSVRSVRANVQTACTIGYVASGLSGLAFVAMS
ncbi:hypothetical protein ZPAH1_orf00063 [Aeromonas phage ZPAH1]|nr:hypothetical protein ASwh1_17 [Aeromonas phage Aswh_1]QQG33825.1 hypothetical protein ZPAH1_orf00063 [Aeromonas phage ZPAH1]